MAARCGCELRRKIGTLPLVCRVPSGVAESTIGSELVPGTDRSHPPPRHHIRARRNLAIRPWQPRQPPHQTGRMRVRHRHPIHTTALLVTARRPFSLYDGHLVRRRKGRLASSRNVRWVSLAGGGGIESSSTSSRRTRCPSYKRLIDVRTGGWLSIGRIGIAPFFSLYDGHRVRRRWGRLASSRKKWTTCQPLFDSDNVPATFRLFDPFRPVSPPNWLKAGAPSAAEYRSRFATGCAWPFREALKRLATLGGIRTAKPPSSASLDRHRHSTFGP